MLLLVGTAASAADVQITRFKAATPDGHIAELCGVVSPPQTVEAIVDANTSMAVSYMIKASQTGQFCALVATYYGRVLVLGTRASYQ